MMFTRLASIEMLGVEWTACNFSTNKSSHAIFGTSAGKLYNFRFSREFANISLASKRETPLFETK